MRRGKMRKAALTIQKNYRRYQAREMYKIRLERTKRDKFEVHREFIILVPADSSFDKTRIHYQVLVYVLKGKMKFLIRLFDARDKFFY